MANDKRIDEAVEDLKKTTLFIAVNEIRRVHVEHRLAVVITHGYLDMMLNTMIERRCKNGKQITEDRRSFTHATKLLLLNETGILSDHHFKLLKWFNKLRNEFAHNPTFKLTPKNLEIFDDVVHGDVAHFGDLCIQILIDIYAMHKSILGPDFLSGMYRIENEKRVMVSVPAPDYDIPLKDDPPTIEREPTFQETLEVCAAKGLVTKADLKPIMDIVNQLDEVVYKGGTEKKSEKPK